MTQAIWKDTVIADSERTVEVEGNPYFPPASLQTRYLRPSDHTSVCPWKGTAHYYDVVVGDQVNANAAWYYPDPKPNAAHIRDHVAFWNGVQIR
ncbi:DUF427 domain-containing protein [Pseudoxanthomonas dokdonensis]|uniref:DUF427 domain-containing protein n=1 Tax=Pseudoxanthomonas dokdonensis TaxID=344882 RepID=A0A0R0D0P4_9GAMM|nr:DUF427 domain-containing protein [Pseudoxanthomonas dokdonensis]KRG71681.1 hypothetical protein ABB29_02735 [Pseudoxanthomonas dokdonensis]